MRYKRLASYQDRTAGTALCALPQRAGIASEQRARAAAAADGDVVGLLGVHLVVHAWPAAATAAHAGDELRICAWHAACGVFTGEEGGDADIRSYAPTKTNQLVPEVRRVL